MSHLHPRVIRSVLAVTCLFAVAAAEPALAHKANAASGGVGIPDPPDIRAMRCDDGRKAACSGGQVLTLRGEGLENVDEILFRGRRGTHDDQVVAAARQRPHRLKVRVPTAAVTGRVRVLATPQDASAGRLRIDAPETRTAAAEGFVFPIVGRYEIGTSYNQGFGGGRNHRGHDIFAKCGKRIVAVQGGTVQKAAYQVAAGNYVVVDGIDGRSYVYMHMLETPVVGVGDDVVAGQDLGLVGETGRASGCHLHFELWSAPGWYKGGEPIDPLPELEAWAAGG